MEQYIVLDPNLTRTDRLILEGLIRDIRDGRDYDQDEAAAKAKTDGDRSLASGPAKTLSATGSSDSDSDPLRAPSSSPSTTSHRPPAGLTDAVAKPGAKADAPADAATLAMLDALNDASSPASFEPTVFTSVDLLDLQLETAAKKKAAKSGTLKYFQASLRSFLQQRVLMPYVSFCRKHVVRYETDVVFATHLLIYLSTLVPSAAFLLFYRFSWLHGVLHSVIVLGVYMGAYTIMMHQHIHQGGVLRRDKAWTRTVDRLFPYVLDPLMGHTWNSYFYHHVKHHHVEGNGPDDLSSTMRFERDSIRDFGCYLGRFFFLAWFDLPLYFATTKRYKSAVRAGFWELSSYVLILVSLSGAFGLVNGRGAIFTLLLPFSILRVGLMLGNWGQHSFVDPDHPDSDFRSSITVLDVASNRVCFNDGYHTSHHLNPRRHWRDHPRAFVRQKKAYAAEQALVFHGIDYLEVTLRLILWQDYATLAKRMVPMGPAQQKMTLEERAVHLKKLTRPFSEEDIARLFPKSRSAAAWRKKQGLPAA